MPRNSATESNAQKDANARRWAGAYPMDRLRLKAWVQAVHSVKVEISAIPPALGREHMLNLSLDLVS